MNYSPASLRTLWAAIAVFGFSSLASAQTASMTSSGNWNVATNWNASNIGDLVTETVTINNNINPTIINGTSFTVGNTTLANNNNLSINNGGTLNVGNSTNSRNLTTNNNANLTVAGTLVIWGNLVVNNNIVWNITGTVIVKGNVQLGNNGNITVSGGNLTINGDFTGNNNNNVNVPSGSITVGGNVNIGGGSNLNGCTGCFHLSGGCTGPASFCGGSALPITLDSFIGQEEGTSIRLEWATLTELNFDHFVVEHSTDGVNHAVLGKVEGAGTSSVRHEYSFVHRNPAEGSNYYRLKAVDFDLSEEYFETIHVRKTNIDRTVVVYPNPASAFVRVEPNFVPGPADVIEVYSQFGVRVSSFDVVGQTTLLPLGSELPNGIYWLRYLSDQYTHSVQFVVNRQ